MNFQYDENLSQNKFFKQLRLDHPILLNETAPLENWTICIPRSGNIHHEKLKEPEYLLAHILIENENAKIDRSDTFFTNLVGNNLKLCDKRIYISGNSGDDWSTFVTILFEEIFYTKNALKYKVWCIDGPLCTKIDDQKIFVNENTETNLHLIKCLKDAEDVIWAESRSQYLLKKIDHLIQNFTKDISKEHDVMHIADLKIKTKDLVQQCFDILLLNKKLQKKCSNDAFFHKTIQLATETYTINLVYGFLFNAITICSLQENQDFNKILKNLSDISLTHFQVDPELIKIIPYVKLELAKIGNYTNVLDKINCLKRALNAISSSQLKNQKLKDNISIDEILNIFVFAIIKSGGTHWITNLIFLKEFNFLNLEINNEEVHGSECFLTTTLEAAILFIKNEIGTCWKDSVYSTQSTLNNFFQKIINESENEVIEILKKQENSCDDNLLNDLCHPLCDCEKCKNKINKNLITINSANNDGINSLHLSAMRGLPKMLNLLIVLGADVLSKDINNWTALHHSAATGNQNTLLLLLHAGAHIDAETIEKNSPLHLACLNGHEGCVKAILYFSDHMKIKLDINLQNSLGNTALHFASKLGFIKIIKALLEYGIRTDIKNKLNQTPIDYAHNSKVFKLIKNSLLVIESHDNSSDLHFNSNVNSIEMEYKIKIDKVINAISVEDTNLALYYLGIDNISLPIDTEISSTKMPSNNILNFQNSDGLTALHASSYYGNYVLAEILIKIGADPTLKTKSGQTCLHLACQNEKRKSIYSLLNFSKIDIINITDSNKNSCLSTAVKTGNYKIVETILRYKPDLSIRNIERKTPIDIAKGFLYLNIVKLLEDAEEDQINNVNK